MRLIVLHIDAGNDRNGNPRRAYMIFDDTDGHLVGVASEGYYGRQALTEAATVIAVEQGMRAASIRFVELGTISVPPAFYRDLRRGDFAPVLFHG